MDKTRFFTHTNPKISGWIDQLKIHTKPNPSVVWVGLGWVQPTPFRRVKFIKKFEQKIERTLKNIESNKNIMIKKNVDRIQRFVRNTMIVVNTLNFIIRNFNMFQRVTSIRRIRVELTDTVAVKKKSWKSINAENYILYVKKKWNERRNKKRKKTNQITQSLINEFVTIAYLIEQNDFSNQFIF